MNSKESCPVMTLHTLWNFLLAYTYIIGVFMIFLGLFFMIWGGRLFHVTLFITGQLTVVVLIMMIMFYAVYPKNSPFWVVWLTLFVAVGMGTGIGYAT